MGWTRSFLYHRWYQVTVGIDFLWPMLGFAIDKVLIEIGPPFSEAGFSLKACVDS